MTDACAAIVERDDPHLYATALFAPEPARYRLMVLYAFDCELSRATRASKESLIPRMRLQWWRDMIEEAEQGKPAKAHEVAGPLNALIRETAALRAWPFLESMVEGYAGELEAARDNESLTHWQRRRFGMRIDAAACVLCDLEVRPHEDLVPDVSEVLGTAFAIRNAQRMCAAGTPPMIANFDRSAIAALARGDGGPKVRACFQEASNTALEALARARASMKAEWKSLVPALLPVLWSERVLQHASRPDFTPGQLDDIDRPFDGLKLAWRALRGRW